MIVAALTLKIDYEPGTTHTSKEPSKAEECGRQGSQIK